jgi:hypothetical protein
MRFRLHRPAFLVIIGDGEVWGRPYRRLEHAQQAVRALRGQAFQARVVVGSTAALARRVRNIEDGLS